MKKSDDGSDVDREKPKRLVPTPPDFYKLYTAEHVRLGSCPPPPPVPPRFTVFGEDYDLEGPLVPPLESRGIPRLFSKFSSMNNIRIEMKKINNSIMAAFLDLVQILIDCPESKDRIEKLDHLRTLFLNFHQLINELRPAEARHCLYTVQQQQSFHQLELHTKMQNAMSLAQAVIVGIQHMAEKMPELPVPENPPKINDVFFKKDYKIEDMEWILEDATSSTVDKSLLESIKKAKSEVDEEGYILKYWREPPKILKKTRSKKNHPKTRDKVVKLKTSKEFAARKRLKSPPAPDVKLLEKKGIQKDNQDSGMIQVDPTPYPEEERITVVRRNIPEDKFPKFLNKKPPLFYNQKSFNDYVKARGVAPDLDREVQAVRTLRSQLTDALIQKQIEKDSEDEVENPEESQPSSSKVPPLEVIQLDSATAQKLKKKKNTVALKSMKIQYIQGLSDSSDLSDDSGGETENLVALHNAVISTLRRPKKSQPSENPTTIAGGSKNPKQLTTGPGTKPTVEEEMMVLDDEGPKLVPIQKETTSSTDSRGIPILEEEAEEDDRQFQNRRNPSGEEPPPVLEIQKRL